MTEKTRFRCPVSNRTAIRIPGSLHEKRATDMSTQVDVFQNKQKPGYYIVYHYMMVLSLAASTWGCLVSISAESDSSDWDPMLPEVTNGAWVKT